MSKKLTMWAFLSGFKYPVLAVECTLKAETRGE